VHSRFKEFAWQPFFNSVVYSSMLSGGICSLLQNTYRWLLCHCIIIAPGCRHRH